VEDQVLDPCFTAADGETIVCAVFPGTSSPGFQLKLSAPLPPPDVSPHAPVVAFMIELADGTLCHSASGSTLAFDGRRLNYSCVGGSPGEQTVIVGDLETNTVWRAEKATLGRTDGGFIVERSEMVDIQTVWQ
jgi:hypothetical protein